MKLRLRNNSIRLRLLQREVRQLHEIGYISESIDFGISNGESFIYSLRASAKADEIFARFTDDRIEIVLPLKTAENWAKTEEIGLYAEQTISNVTNLKIMVEKDFVCLDRPNDSDNQDAFAGPKTKC